MASAPLKQKAKRVTKKSIKEAVRNLIDRNPLDIHFNQQDVDELNRLLGTAYKGFVRGRNPRYPDTRYLCYIEGDKKISFSWNDRLSPRSAAAELTMAMRESIRPYTNSFKDSHEPKKCAKCGSVEHLQTDHKSPPFSQIFDEFVAENGLPDIVDHPTGVGFSFLNLDVEKNWVEFHNERAVYQLLCRSCNASKGAK